jgi:uncharacterized protein YjbI with pentapeptide repeats
MPRQRAKIVAPHLAGEESYEPFGGERLSSGEAYSRVAFRQIDLSSSRAADLRFEEVTLYATVLRGSACRGVGMTDARLRGCDLSNVDWQQGIFQRVEFETCNLTGANLGTTQMANTQFERCKMLLARFGHAKLAACAFCNCNLEQVDFSGADLRQVVFESCNLLQARFFGANLQGADLRKSNLTEIGATPHDLRGAIVDATQLIHFAPLLGLIVE